MKAEAVRLVSTVLAAEVVGRRVADRRLGLAPEDEAQEEDPVDGV